MVFLPSWIFSKEESEAFISGLRKFFTTKGVRWDAVLKAFVPAMFWVIFNLIQFLITSVIDALSNLWTQVPVLVDMLKSSGTSNLSGHADLLASANYLFPLDFLFACLTLYWSLQLSLITCGVFSRVFNFLLAVRKGVFFG